MDKFIHIRITAETHQQLKQICKAEGMMIAVFAGRAIEKEISRINVVKKTKSGLKK